MNETLITKKSFCKMTYEIKNWKNRPYICLKVSHIGKIVL